MAISRSFSRSAAKYPQRTPKSFQEAKPLLFSVIQLQAQGGERPLSNGTTLSSLIDFILHTTVTFTDIKMKSKNLFIKSYYGQY